jgi:RNA polymerase sigma-70 factor (ECF subfamily)
MTTAAHIDDGDGGGLIRHVGGGGPAALAALYHQFGGAVLAIGLRVLRNRWDAEDLRADVFAEALARPDRYDPARGSVATYLSVVAHSRAIDHVRGRPPRRPASPPASVGGTAAAADDPAALAESAEQRLLIADVLRQLNPAQRQVIELAFFEGLTHPQIAARLGRPLGTVKTHIRKGLARARHLLQRSSGRRRPGGSHSGQPPRPR